MNTKRRTHFTVYAAAIAALYIALTWISSLFGLDRYAVQLRLSEMLTVLPVFLPEAVPGLFIGCILSNLLTGCAVWDIIFGSLATLLGAIFTRRFRKHIFLALFSPIFFNSLIVPPVIFLVYGSDFALPIVYVLVFAGELVSCGIFGFILYQALKKTRIFDGAIHAD